MKKILLVLLMAAGSATMFAQEHFGDVKVNPDAARQANVVTQIVTTDKPAEDITITGEVKGVCQAKGCWMTLQLDNGEEMTVKFKDYAFFMPKDCAGKKIIAHGRAFKKVTSVKELRHLAEDAGKSKKEIKKIKEPKEEFRFEADGVILES